MSTGVPHRPDGADHRGRGGGEGEAGAGALPEGRVERPAGAVAGAQRLPPRRGRRARPASGPSAPAAAGRARAVPRGTGPVVEPRPVEVQDEQLDLAAGPLLARTRRLRRLRSGWATPAACRRADLPPRLAQDRSRRAPAAESGSQPCELARPGDPARRERSPCSRAPAARAPPPRSPPAHATPAARARSVARSSSKARCPPKYRSRFRCRTAPPRR